MKHFGSRTALALFALLLCPSAPADDTGAGTFDLGVKSVEVTDKGSSTMFRRVRVSCVVVNHGPGVAPSKVRVRLTRPSGSKRKLVRSLVTQYAVPPGKSFFIAGEDTVWHRSLPSYECAIDYGPPGALRVIGDSNASNDIGQSTDSR